MVSFPQLILEQVSAELPYISICFEAHRVNSISGVETFEIQMGKMTLDPLSIPTTTPLVDDEIILHKEEALLNGERGTVITLRTRK